MVKVSYGATEPSRVSRNYISLAGHISIVLVVATLMVMVASTTYIVFGTGDRSPVALQSFDPVER